MFPAVPLAFKMVFWIWSVASANKDATAEALEVARRVAADSAVGDRHRPVHAGDAAAIRRAPYNSPNCR